MQRAARKVAQENVRLRSLLAHHGVRQDEVEIYLRSFDEVEALKIAPIAAAATSKPHQHGSSERASNVALDALQASVYNQRASHGIVDNNSNVHSLEVHASNLTSIAQHPETSGLVSDCQIQTVPPSSRATENLYDVQDNRRFDDVECPNTSDCFCPPTAIVTNQNSSCGLEISCETAANIIVEMRGEGDLDSVRASLGCVGREKCSVRNSTVLQIMDER
jgi:hypothetical protein